MTAEQSKVYQQILSHLLENPACEDTLEGIARWWLLQQEIKRSMAQIQEVITHLVESGLLVERKRRNSPTYYRINQDKYQEISALLEKESRAEE